MDIYFKAISFAEKAHRGQYRKGSSAPYLIHPLGVMQTLIRAGCKHEVVVAGCLHDIVEDTNYSLDDIYNEFGSRVAELVYSVTEPNKKDPWINRKVHTIENMKATTDKDILYLSCADKIDNVASTLKDYGTLGEELWTKFKGKKEQQKWYYHSLSEVFTTFDSEEPMFQELQLLTFKLFPTT